MSTTADAQHEPTSVSQPLRPAKRRLGKQLHRSHASLLIVVHNGSRRRRSGRQNWQYLGPSLIDQPGKALHVYVSSADHHSDSIPALMMVL